MNVVAQEPSERPAAEPARSRIPEEFPLPNGDQAGPSSSAAGAGGWAAMSGGMGRAPRPEDFPALPGMLYLLSPLHLLRLGGCKLE